MPKKDRDNTRTVAAIDTDISRTKDMQNKAADT